MSKPLTRPQAARPPLRDICLVTGNEKTPNPSAATWLDAVQRAWKRLIPEYPPPMQIGRKKFKGEWR